MYHELGDDAQQVDAWTVVRRSDFLNQIEELRRHYDIVAIDEALVRCGARQRGSRPLAVLTFDDGDARNHDLLLPIVERERLPVTLYISTGHIRSQRCYWFDRVVNAAQADQPVVVDLDRAALGRFSLQSRKGPRRWAEIQRLLEALKTIEPVQREALADDVVAQMHVAGCCADAIKPLSVAQVRDLGHHPLVTIGAHSDCHNLLTQLPTEAARDSIATSARLLRDWSGQPVRHFAYPNGTHDAPLASLVRDLGFLTATSTRPGLWRPNTDLMSVPRIGVGRYDDLTTLRFNLLGLRDEMARGQTGALRTPERVEWEAARR